MSFRPGGIALERGNTSWCVGYDPPRLALPGRDCPRDKGGGMTDVELLYVILSCVVALAWIVGADEDDM